MTDEHDKPKQAHADGGITKDGVRKAFWITQEEAEDLRVAAF